MPMKLDKCINDKPDKEIVKKGMLKEIEKRTDSAENKGHDLNKALKKLILLIEDVVKS